jgi:hypothetical protein
LKYLGGPGLGFARSLFGKCARLTRGNAINEVLFYDARILRRVKEAVDSHCRLMYCDSLRLAQYAQPIEIPWILDLDDLLSLRFGQFLRNDEIDITQVLGHFGSLVPRPLKSVMGMVLRPLLKWESALLGQRERFWASQANEVSLVSSVEAKSFCQQVDRDIHALPMSVPDTVPDCRWQVKEWKRDTTLRAVFVGYLAYQPNLEAITFLAEKAIPYLRAGGIDLEVSVIGNTNGIELPESVTGCPKIKMRGFVADLDAEFDMQHFFVAPIFTGTGVKTKVLEAMRFGIPVVGTPLALSGLDLPDADRLEWQTPESLAATLQRLRDGEQIERISENSRAYVNEYFSVSAVRSRWDSVIDQLVSTNHLHSRKR